MARERILGSLNPMKRPEIAAKISAAAKERMLDPTVRAAFVAAAGNASRTPELNAQRAAKARAYWTPERKQEAKEREAARQNKIRQALALMGESQHG